MSDADLVVRVSRKRALLAASGWFALFAVVIPIVLLNRDVLGVVIIGTFGPGLLLSGCYELYTSGKRWFTITSRGIEIPTLGDFGWSVGWSDISAIRLFEADEHLFLGIDLLPSAVKALEEAISPKARVMKRYSQARVTKRYKKLHDRGFPNIYWPANRLSPNVGALIRELEKRTVNLVRTEVTYASPPPGQQDLFSAQ